MSLVAFRSGFICSAQVEGPSHQGNHHMVYLCFNLIFRLSNRNFVCGLSWCRGHFIRNWGNVRHYSHLQQWKSSRDWVRRNSRHHTWTFRIKNYKGSGGHTCAGTCLWSLSYLNVDGSLGSSSSFITTFALKSLRWAPSNISTGDYTGMAPILSIMRLMLS